MKCNNLYRSLTILACIVQTTIPSGRDSNVCSNIIAGNQVQGSNQNASCHGGDSEGGLLESAIDMLNSYKDRVDWKMTDYETKNLGRIKKAQKVTIKYPAVGKMKHFSFQPTEGTMQDKKIELLFVSFSIHGKTNGITIPEAVQKQLQTLKKNKSPFKNVVKVYRKLEGETQWIEFAELYARTNPDAKKLEVTFTVLPDGSAEATEKLYRTDAEDVTTEYESNRIDLTVLL